MFILRPESLLLWLNKKSMKRQFKRDCYVTYSELTLRVSSLGFQIVTLNPDVELGMSLRITKCANH